jgi:RNA polymerase sigma-70 factor (ECF subfamily)
VAIPRGPSWGWQGFLELLGLFSENATSEVTNMPTDHWPDALPDLSVAEPALVGRVAVGDRSALEILYHRYYFRLTGFLWRAIGHRESIEEIIDDTFTWVWISAGHFREAEVVSTWVFRIAYRKALEYMSQQMSPTAWYGTRRPPKQFIATQNDRRFGDRLAQALKAMPYEQRLTLLLAYQVGFSVEQTAAITGVPAETVIARMLRARQMLRCFLPALATNISGAVDVD